MKRLWEWFVRCRHKFSWPITVKGRTYQVCSKCGVEVNYDWKQMRRMA